MSMRSIRLLAVVLLTGLMTARANATTLSATTTYDLVGRVATVHYDNGVCVTYSYDAVGNRTAQTNTTDSGPVTPVWGTGTWGCFNWSATATAQAKRVSKSASIVANRSSPEAEPAFRADVQKSKSSGATPAQKRGS